MRRTFRLSHLRYKERFLALEAGFANLQPAAIARGTLQCGKADLESRNGAMPGEACSNSAIPNYSAIWGLLLHV